MNHIIYFQEDESKPYREILSEMNTEINDIDTLSKLEEITKFSMIKSTEVFRRKIQENVVNLVNDLLEDFKDEIEQA